MDINTYSNTSPLHTSQATPLRPLNPSNSTSSTTISPTKSPKQISTTTLLIKSSSYLKNSSGQQHQRTHNNRKPRRHQSMIHTHLARHTPAANCPHSYTHLHSTHANSPHTITLESLYIQTENQDIEHPATAARTGLGKISNTVPQYIRST